MKMVVDSAFHWAAHSVETMDAMRVVWRDGHWAVNLVVSLVSPTVDKWAARWVERKVSQTVAQWVVRKAAKTVCLKAAWKDALSVAPMDAVKADSWDVQLVRMMVVRLEEN